MVAKDWIYLSSVLITLVGLGVAFIRNFSNERAARREELHKKLNCFYVPLLLQIEVLKQLNISFKGGDDFRILETLLKGESLEKNQPEILSKILEIERSVEKLILEGAGLVDKDLFSSMPNELEKELLRRPSSEDQDYGSVYEVLQDFLVHIQILRMAANGKIAGEVDTFKIYVFPRILDHVVEQKVFELKIELSKLNKTTWQCWKDFVEKP